MIKVNKLRSEARQCVRVADRTADNKIAAALLAYACELEQRARQIDNAKVRYRKSSSPPEQDVAHG